MTYVINTIERDSHAQNTSTLILKMCIYVSFPKPTVTTEAFSNSDPSVPNETTEDNPDGGCHIYRYGYYTAGIAIVGNDVSQ